MGYSIAVPLKSHKARDEMVAFLEGNYRSWHLVQPQTKDIKSPYYTGFIDAVYDWTRFLTRDGNLAYDDGKCRIGFNYTTSHGPCGEYAVALLRWVALRSGRKRKFPKYGLDQAVPYLVYDGYEGWPVLNRHEWEDKVQDNARWCLVSPDGFKPVRRPWMSPRSTKTAASSISDQVQEMVDLCEPFFKDQERAIQEEMARLTGLWDIRR